ncbi:4867_t:CDS:2 [Diversispora eburnea]|uniref:4867_t:CDS:1 n=1 Tax=Diversispora eburnea TaxID=1213867 RepID=A0A9N9F4G5_9GLOM|nr:4867_t:CDS:2 [Diversispora eburnea]
MSQLASTIPTFTEPSAICQEKTTTDKIPMVVNQRHKPSTTKKRASKQEDSDDYEGTLNEPVAYRPYPVTNMKIKRTKYSTSLDPRGYIPVYEFTINDQPIMWDRENGYVHFTGIWKALGNNKADIARLVDTHPDLALTIKKVRGGFLKIQGTWFAYELCRRTCYVVREELIPLFGPEFPSQALDPTQPGYGRLTLSDSVPTKKRQRRKPKDARTDNSTSTTKGKAKTMIKLLASPLEEENSHDIITYETKDDIVPIIDQQYHKNVKVQGLDTNHRHLVILRKHKRISEDDLTESITDNLVSKRRRQRSPTNSSLGDDEDSSTEEDRNNLRRGSVSTFSSISQHHHENHDISHHHEYQNISQYHEQQQNISHHHEQQQSSIMNPTDTNEVPPENYYEFPHSPPATASPILTFPDHSINYSPNLPPDRSPTTDSFYYDFYTPYPPPTIHPLYPHQPPSPLTEHDLYDAINATLALQQLSQDNGDRPLEKEQMSNAWPRNFIMGNREFQFIGCRYRVVRYW